MNDESRQNEIRWFWTLSQGLLVGNDMPIWELVDELRMLEAMTDQPALKLRCAALIRQHEVFLVGASAS